KGVTAPQLHPRWFDLNARIKDTIPANRNIAASEQVSKTKLCPTPDCQMLDSNFHAIIACGTPEAVPATIRNASRLAAAVSKNNSPCLRCCSDRCEPITG